MNKSVKDKPRPRGIGNVPGRQRVTMHDIARAAGCSQPTVSFVLNGTDAVKISEATKSRVFEAAQQLGYKIQSRSNQSPISGAGQLPYIDGPIAFIVDNLAGSPECVNAFDGVMQAVKSTGNIVMLAETNNDPIQEPKIIQHFLDQQVAAVIYACVFTREVQVPEVLRQTTTPVFLLNCYTSDLSFPSVIPVKLLVGIARHRN